MYIHIAGGLDTEQLSCMLSIILQLEKAKYAEKEMLDDFICV